MINEKPSRTFIMCDKENNEYEINEFKSITIFDQKKFTQKPKEILNIYYSTSKNEPVTIENDTYFVEVDSTKIKLYDCES